MAKKKNRRPKEAYLVKDVTLAQLWEAKDALEKLMACEALDITIIWRLSSLASPLIKLVQAHQKLVMKHSNGTKTPDDDFRVAPENAEIFHTEWGKLLEEPIEGVPAVGLDDLIPAKPNAFELGVLRFMILDPDVGNE
ncbi:MAG: hypothetical protein ACYTEQ_09405 [Planctomycetota bacterium]|jgi:hypothetical protein